MTEKSETGQNINDDTAVGVQEDPICEMKFIFICLWPNHHFEH